MARNSGPRSSADDLAYGEIPQRWDRDRFERFSGGSRRYDEDDEYRFVERERPGRREVVITEREHSRGPRGRFEEKTRIVEEDSYKRGTSRPRRRTDRELFGDVDPRELADMAVTPYRRRRSSGSRPALLRRQSSLDTFDRRPIPRYEREEHRIPVYTAVPVPYRVAERRWEDEEYDNVRYRAPEDYREVEIQRERSVHRSRPKGGHSKAKSSAKSHASTRRSKAAETSSSSSSSSSSSETVEEVEEKSTTRRGGGGGSTTKSVHESFHGSTHESAGGGKTVHETFHETVRTGGGSKAPSKARSSGVAESFHESVHESVRDDQRSFHESISESIHDTQKKFKKGKTRMPKRLVRREAIMDLGYPFDEEEMFFVLRIALEKEQIDEVIRITESYNSGAPAPAPEPERERERDREEVIRTEWINPPTVVGESSGTTRRGGRSRARSHANEEVFEERKTVYEERSSNHLLPPAPLPPPPPPIGSGGGGTELFEEQRTTIEERSPSHVRSRSSHIRVPSNPHHNTHGALILQDREYRSDRDIQAEIRALESERRALRLEREADDRRALAVRIREHHPTTSEHVHVLDLTERRPNREFIELEREPPKTVLRVEKDRKGRMALVRSTH